MAADMEASWESADGGAAEGGRAMIGGVGGESLPPRKRLLAGLRQNGWLSSSPPPSVSPGTEGFLLQGRGGVVVGHEGISRDHDDGEGNKIVAEVGGGGGGVVGAEEQEEEEEEGCCAGCHCVENNSTSGAVGMRRIKHGNVYLRLCESCALLYKKRMFCPHCLAVYHDSSLLGDPALWLLCCRCQRSVHAECANKQTSVVGTTIDASSYICPDCVSMSSHHKEGLNGLSDSRNKVRSGAAAIMGGNFSSTDTGVSTSAIVGADCSSPSFKKPRISRERPKLEDTDHADPSKLERERMVQDGGGVAGKPKSKNLIPVRKISPGMTVPLSPHDTAVAAKSAAAQAVKVAMAAKENAAAKASAAVKAAAAAKEALEAAALAARAVAHARADLRRKTANSEPRLAESSSKLQIVLPPGTQKEKMFGRTDVKVEKEEKQVGHSIGATSLDDEELARQLHRVINSSPRISCSLTPLPRKSSLKNDTPSSGVSNSSPDAARTWPRHSQTSPAEPLSQPKPQQTRPRSVTHKDFRRFGPRVPRHEVKKTDEIGQNAGQQPDGFEHSSPDLPSNPSNPHASETVHTAMKTEALEGVVTSSPRGDPLTTAAENSAEFPFDAMVEAEAGAAHPISDLHDRRPDFLQEILEAAVLADSAMSLEEGADTNVHEEAHRSECDGGSGQQEAHNAFSHLLAETNEDKSGDAIVLDEVPSAAAPPIPAGNSSAALQDVQMVEANIHHFEDFGAAEMVDADDVDMALKESGAAETGDADDVDMALKDLGAVEAMCRNDAELVLQDPAPEVVRANDADSAKDSGVAEAMLTDLPSRVTPVGVLDAGSQTVVSDQEVLVMEPGLETNSGCAEVAEEADLEENMTVDGKYLRPGCKETQDVTFEVSDCGGTSEASSEHVLVKKEEDPMQVGLEETTADGGDSRPDCKQTENLSSVGGTEPCNPQETLLHNDAGSSGSLEHAAEAHEETVTTWPQNKLKVLPIASQSLGTGASMAPFSSATQMPMQTPTFASGPGG
ncbi:unnamed protein product [Sphagnum troendelagicum]